MVTRISSKSIVTPQGVLAGYVYMKDGKISAVTTQDLPFESEIDAGECFVLPGLIDLHTHGAVGFDFCEADPDGILRAVEFHLQHGTTAILPTVTSSTYENTYRALESIEKAMQDPRLGACILGAHLEGPYFSPAQCGGQDPAVITAPVPQDYEKLIDRFGPIIKRWDYAPERDENGVFCAYLKAHGILPSAGHTNAVYNDVCVARENGCRLITHLYSCTSTITREKGFRRLGVTECAYLFDDMYVEIIADGKHLPPELLRLIFKLKPHDKIIAITDSLKVVGEGKTHSNVGSIPCIVEDGVCKLLDRSAFAGSVATADLLLRVCTKEAGLNITEAVRVCSTNAAQLFKLNKGALCAGADADVVVLDRTLTPRHVFLAGEKML